MLDLWLSLEASPVVEWVNKTPLITCALGIVSLWLLEFFWNYREYKLLKLWSLPLCLHLWSHLSFRHSSLSTHFDEAFILILQYVHIMCPYYILQSKNWCIASYKSKFILTNHLWFFPWVMSSWYNIVFYLIRI